MLDEHFFNVVDQRWNNVDPNLKMKQNSTLDYQPCITLIQRRRPKLKQPWKNLVQRRFNLLQRWYNIISTLFQRSLNIS